MGSLIKIPRKYDLEINETRIEVICTDHRRSIILRAIVGFVGVDEVIRLIEEHENKFH